MATPMNPTHVPDPASFLAGDAIVEIDHPAVLALGDTLLARSTDEVDFARRAFEWVRDEVAHSYDAQDPRVTLLASEVLAQRVGLCYAKSHLLAAVLRGKGVPTALCYQRLAHGDGHVLHGLVAVHLGGAWHRQDPRGNREDISAEFSVDGERLAWTVDPTLGEIDYPTFHLAPAGVVVEALQRTTDVLSIYDVGLPSALA
ncbi:transglutaminase family protein [Rhodococcus sp. NPDC058505]|uniref:transglutaminase-like domain-containing protein n=1 Tax=unclassified Rhodococcus (in: high G+C Gram-positive bacteria) TaxID=192944 RepID=UPI003659982B